MGSSRIPPPPETIDPGQSMGEYLFGTDFGNAQGITDPALQNRLLEAEQRYRPQYAALELADIGTYAQGIAGGKDNPAYKRLEAQLAGLEAGEGGVSDAQAMKIAQSTVGAPPSKTKTIPGNPRARFGKDRSDKTVPNPDYEKQLQEYNNEVKQIADSLGGNRESQIASIKEQMTQLEGQEGQAGLFDLLEDQSRRAGDLQREQLGLQRADDVSALQEFAPQVVEAYREADPYSTGLAEQQTAMANDLYQRSQGLNPEQQRLVDQQALGMAQSQGRVTDQSAIAGQLLGRESYLSGLRSQAAGMGQQAFNQNRQLAGDVGMTILGRPSASINLGSQSLQSAQQNAAAQAGPNLFDANAGYNAALQQRGQDISYQGAQAQANASKSSGIMGLVGALGGGYLGGL